MRTSILALLVPLHVLLSASLDASRGQQDPWLRAYSVRDGLSQSSVYAVLQDRRGFMWFGTEDGLNRFDGYRFEVFRPEADDPGSLSHNHVRALLEDASGDIWIGTFGGHLDRFDAEREVFTRFRHDPDLPEAAIEALYEDRDGYLWIGTYGEGLFRLDPARRSLDRFRHPAAGAAGHDRVLAILEDLSGDLWIGTEGGLERFDRDRSVYGAAFSGAVDEGARGVTTLYEDGAGLVWAGTAGGWLYAVDPRSSEPARPLHGSRCPPAEPSRSDDHHITTIFEDDDARLWIAASRGGLFTLDRDGGRCEALSGDEGVPSELAADYLLSVYPDRAGNLWIATFAGGVKYLVRHCKPFRRLVPDPGDPESLSAAYVHAIFEDRQGALWIGTEGGGLDRLDRGAAAFRHYRPSAGDPASLADDTVWTIFEDSHGELWIGTRQGGLDRFDRASETFVHYRADPRDSRRLKSDNVRVIYEDRSRTLWIATVDGALHRYNRGTDLFERFVVAPENPGDFYRNTVTHLLETRSGVFWTGTLRGPMLFDLRRGQFREPPRESSGRLHRARIRAFHEDAAGRLWIATQGEGLFVFDAGTGRYSSFRVEHGLPNDVIYGILEDERGRLWLSTNHGISRFDPATEQFRNYDVRDGLVSNEFNAGAFHRGRDGTFYFGGVHGVSAFDPEAIRDSTFVPPVVVTGVQLAYEPAALERAVLATREIYITHRDRVVSFEFAALSFARPEDNRYAYYLEGFENDWVESGSRRFVTYTNLPAGRYVFRVKAATSDGVWNEEGTSIRLTVAAAPWRSGWAFAIYGAALAAFLAVVLRSQRKEILRERQAAARERRAAERERAAAWRLREVDKLKDEYLQKIESLAEERAVKLEERERLLRERGDLIEELRARHDELAQLHYTVSHDLRNPLVTIKNFLGLAQRDAAARDPEQLDRDLVSIAEAADEIEERLRGLIAFSRLGRQGDLLEEIPMSEVALEAVALCSEMITERGVSVEVAPELPTAVGDRRRLLIVFESLLDNAVKFMGDQEEPRIEIDGRVLAKESVYSVRDNGIGIDGRYHEKIFGLFDRLDSDTRDSGAGLALVRRIVEAHGGRIWVESKGAGHGSSFCFALPSLPH